ncbi:MAG: helix-turn-helix transcriptional regulator [Nanoarchaeota archaeon]|nr:helix-turn-helix transcriptional regulator [Nanoarchaeota archaeon]
MNITYKTTINKFNLLKRKTNNFTKIDYKLFLEDISYITIFRTITGYTINKFARKIGIAYPWIYNLENKKSKLGEKGAKNIANQTYKLFNALNLINNVNEEDLQLNYKSLNNIKIESNIDLENLSKKDFKEFLEIFIILEKDTKNFKYFPSSLLLQDSRIILPVRLILGLTQKEFAKEAEISNMTVEELENGYRKIKWMETTRRYAEKIEQVMKKKYVKINEKELKQRWQKWKNTRKTKAKNILNWKRIREMNTNDFLKYLKIIKKESKNFTKITPDLFQQNPQAIMIFRILIGLTQKNLERKLNILGKVNVYNYENLNYTLSRGNAELFANFFKKEIKNTSEEEALNTFLHVKESMFSYRKGALNNLKKIPLNEQEKKIINELKKEGKIIKNLKIHENFDTGKGITNIDFIINNNDPIFIEATKFYDIKSKKFASNWKQRIFLLDYRFSKIKKKLPQSKAFIVIELENNPQLEYRIKKFIKEQTIAIDDIFINSEFERLNKVILGEIN